MGSFAPLLCAMLLVIAPPEAQGAAKPEAPPGNYKKSDKESVQENVPVTVQENVQENVQESVQEGVQGNSYDATQGANQDTTQNATKPGPETSKASPDGTESVDPAAASPVELIPKVEIRHSFAQVSRSQSVNTTTARIDIGFLRRVLLRYEITLPHVKAGDAVFSGVGDTRFQAITLITSSRRQLTVAIAGVVLNTATQPQLGIGKQQVFFGGGAALKVRRWLLLYAVLQEQLSVAGDANRANVNQLSGDLGALVFGEKGAWYKVDLYPSVDFESNDGRLLGNLEIGALAIGSVGLFVRAGTQLLGPHLIDYTIESGVRYLFRLGKTM